ncbi:PRC-barrel domain-containing protein [Streptomyces sp. NPDC051218]|uniref:PRC-barrel domain-containing protein n=1 Tax=Streptomyces sp. NPDC051218 TaxID=3365645 RepID=UPI0037B4D3C9
MMLLSQVLGHPVISAEDARPVGQMAGAGIDPRTRRITELYLRDAKNGGDSVPWSQVRGMGPDAVIVDTGTAAATEAGGGGSHSRAHKRLLGKRVLTEYGEDIGTLTEVTFDPETGSIGDLYVGREQVPGSRLVGLGSYALVLGAGPTPAPGD